jgi:hypothetical protein
MRWMEAVARVVGVVSVGAASLREIKRYPQYNSDLVADLLVGLHWLPLPTRK